MELVSVEEADAVEVVGYALEVLDSMLLVLLSVLEISVEEFG